jgi:undecaprenyl-diphosphatase
MGGLVDAILGLSGPAAYALVGLLAFGEAAAFLGLVLPGEVAVLLGGVVASSGNASLPVMVTVAVVAAVAGDSVGYELGRRYGPSVLAWPPFERRFGAKVAQASSYLQERGGRAVFLGRWTSLLRALVPGLAGMARMPYGRFLAYNVVGGVAWATTFVMLGYLAGASWRSVERIAGRASLLLLALLLLGLGVRWSTRRLVARADGVRAWLDRLTRTAPVRWAARHFATPLSWAARRVTPGTTRGLGWSLSVLGAGAGAWVLGVAVQDLLAGEELVLLDRPLAGWIAARTTPAAVDVATVVRAALGPPGGVWFVAALAWLAGRRAGRAAGLQVVVASVLAAAVALVLTLLLPVSVAGTEFPAPSVGWLTAAVVAAAPAMAGAGDLRPAIRLTGGGVAMVLLAGAAELVAGAATLSGLVGGVGIGLLLGVGGELTARTVAAGTATEPTVADG